MSPEGAPTPDEEAFSDEEIEAARVLFARPAVFLMGAVSVDGLPSPDLPEVAFAGRSNVGKSSLINGLVGQKHLARASNEPGRTREVNFFVVDERVRLVDLPGYGWARAGKGEVKKFQALGRDYLRGRPNLRRAYLLIDARHGLKDVDEEPMAAFDRAAVSYQVILTKADKLRPAEVEAVRARTEAQGQQLPPSGGGQIAGLAAIAPPSKGANRGCQHHEDQLHQRGVDARQMQSVHLARIGPGQETPPAHERPFAAESRGAHCWARNISATRQARAMPSNHGHNSKPDLARRMPAAASSSAAT